MTDDQQQQDNSASGGDDDAFTRAIAGAFEGMEGDDEARSASALSGGADAETVGRGLSSPAVSIGDAHRALPASIPMDGPVPGPKAPDAVARLLLHLLADAGCHLLHWRDEWHLWRQGRSGGAYRRMDGADNRYAVADFARATLADAVYLAATKDGSEPRPWAPTRASVAEVVDAMAAQSRPSESMADGAWLTGDLDVEAEIPAREVTCVANGLLWNPRGEGLGARLLMDHTPEYFTTASVAVDWDEAAEAPRWSRFLDELWPGDADSQALLQEWFGYVLAGSTTLHKILTLVGPPRSGKSTIAWVLEALLGGPTQVDHPTMVRLAEPFGLASMLGKRLAVVGDARLGKSDAGIVERLLMISGEDPVTVQRKYLSDVTIQLSTRIMIISNAMPDLRDTSGALSSRFLPLEINVKGFLGQEDFNLKRTLGAELPGVLRWAMEGADRLWRREGRFTIGENVRAAMAENERLSSPVKAFAQDRLVFEAEVLARKDYVYESYALWCAETGYHPKGKNVFFRDLMSAYRGELDTGKNIIDGQQRPTLRGARLV